MSGRLPQQLSGHFTFRSTKRSGPTAGQESSMGKVLEFKRVKKAVKELNTLDIQADGIGSYIDAVMNDYSLTVANRHWILQNMLMDIDDELAGYSKELEVAEKKLDTLVKSAEKEIAAAYSDFNAHVGGMAHAVRNLTMSAPRQGILKQSADTAADDTLDQQTNPL
jgi:hypothetical protein